MELQTPIPLPRPPPPHYQINDEAERRAKTDHFSIFDIGGRGGVWFAIYFLQDYSLYTCLLHRQLLL